MTLYRSLSIGLTGLGLIALVGASSPSRAAQAAHKAKKSAKQAEAAALKKYRGGKIAGKTELENEDGKWQYAVMVRAGGKMHEVMVGADNGKIASEEVVTAKEEAAEKHAETAAKKHAKPGKGAKAKKPEGDEAGEKDEK